MTGGGGQQGEAADDGRRRTTRRGCRRREAAGDRALNATRQSQTRRSGRRCPSGKQGNLFHSLWTVRWSFPHVWMKRVHTCGKLPFIRCRERQPSGFTSADRLASLDRLPRRAALSRRRRKGFRGRCAPRRRRVRNGRTRVDFREEASKGLLRSRICVGGAGENRFRRPSGGPKRPVWCGKEGDKSAGRPACVHSFSTGKERRSTGRMTRVSLITQTQALVV